MTTRTSPNIVLVAAGSAESDCFVQIHRKIGGGDLFVEVECFVGHGKTIENQEQIYDRLKPETIVLLIGMSDERPPDETAVDISAEVNAAKRALALGIPVAIWGNVPGAYQRLLSGPFSFLKGRICIYFGSEEVLTDQSNSVLGANRHMLNCNPQRHTGAVDSMVEWLTNNVLSNAMKRCE